MGNISRATLEAEISAADGGTTTTTTVYHRGVNDSGGDDGVGAYGTEWHFDGAPSLEYIQSRGHTIVRIPFLWENFQSSLDATITASALTELTEMVARVEAAGMTAVLDCHNYGRYTNETTGVTNILGDGTLTAANIANLWTQLSTAFNGNAGVYAYGLMNEPHDFVGTTGAYTPSTTFYSFASSTSGWTATASTGTPTVTISTATTYDGAAGSLQCTIPSGNTTVQLGDNDPDGEVDRTATPTIAAWVMVPTQSGFTGDVSAQLLFQNSAYDYDLGGFVTLTPGTWTELIYTPPSGDLSESRGLGVQFDFANATTAAVEVYVDNFTGGTQETSTTGAQVWEEASQTVLSAIRSNGDDTLIMVGGYGYSGAEDWTSNNAEPWITDPASNFKYEAHYYPDTGNAGTFPYTFATETSNATAAGYASVPARATSDMQVFTAWLSQYDVAGYLGETGWPDNADITSWNTVGTAIYDAADAAAIDATYWNCSEWNGVGNAYPLAVYAETTADGPLAQAQPQATIVEEHLTKTETSSSDTAYTAGTDITITDGVIEVTPDSFAPYSTVSANATGTANNPITNYEGARNTALTVNYFYCSTQPTNAITGDVWDQASS